MPRQQSDLSYARFSDDLKWHWAVVEQSWLHYKHDAYWIESIKNGGFTEEDWKRFLRSYGLARGKYGDPLRSNFDKIWDRCIEAYKQLPPNADHNIIQERWQAVTQYLQSITSSPQRNDGYNLPSASMKIFWFFQPRSVPMYDTYAKNALHSVERTRFPDTPWLDFLPRFQRFFDRSETAIEKAIVDTGLTYPYRRRIADKRLWIDGNKDHRSFILRSYEVAVRLQRASQTAPRGLSA